MGWWAMFLRRNRRTIGGELYEYWTLVESHRTERGPRQRVVATLGKVPGLDEGERRGWEEIGWLLEGRRGPKQMELGAAGEVEAKRPDWAQVDLSGVRVERVRDFGAVYLALSLTVLPLFVIYFLLSKYIISGVALGALKE